MFVDMQDAIEIGPLVDGSYCFVAPDSEPLVTRGPVIPNKIDVWYVAVFGLGSRGHFHMVQGWYPVRQFHEKADAVALHDMLKRKEIGWVDAIEVVIADGKRGLIGTPKLLTGSNVPSIADLHKGRNLRR